LEENIHDGIRKQISKTSFKEVKWFSWENPYSVWVWWGIGAVFLEVGWNKEGKSFKSEQTQLLLLLFLLLGFEFRASDWLSRRSTAGATLSALFDMVVFQIESHFFPVLPGSWSSILHFPSLLGWHVCTTMPSCWLRCGLFCWGWPW
jgi:hypothetical protein